MNVPVLDHGYVRLVEDWGRGDAGEAEAAVIEAARQSTQGSFRGWEKDERLLRFLWENRHATPFEFAGMTLEVQAPIFVFREWHRHRTQSYNEMSARYAPLPALDYVPEWDDVRARAISAGENKQAGSVAQWVEPGAKTWHALLPGIYEQLEGLYQDALACGVPKELARIILPVGRYSRMRATANLRNWLAFLTLRLHPDAQAEIRRYAEAVGRIVADRFPRVWSLFQEGLRTG